MPFVASFGTVGSALRVSAVRLAEQLRGRGTLDAPVGAAVVEEGEGGEGAPAKQPERPWLSSARMFTARRCARSITGWMERARPTQMSTSGGSRLTEVKALTVVPQGWMPCGVSTAAGMTVTPAKNRPRTSG